MHSSCYCRGNACFIYLSSSHTEILFGVPSNELLGSLAYEILGPYAGLIAGLTAAFACLTTEIALTAVFAQFLHRTCFKERCDYQVPLLITIAVSFCFALLDFDGITAFLVPILQICYPALIILSLLNLMYKMFDFKPVRFPVYSAFVLSLINYFYQR